MSRQTWGLKEPEKFLFKTSTLVAKKFRRHCAINQYMIGRVLEDLVIDYLIANGEADSRDALIVQEQMEK